MSKSLTKTVGPAWAMPSIPRGIRVGVGTGVPLLATFWVLADRLSGLPGGAWQWEVRPELLLAVVLLAPVNWGLEACKWADLLPSSPLVKRFREVLYGTAWSLIGPFRMGAVVGRVGAVPKANRNHALRAFVTGSTAQWWCTITGAGIALALMGFTFPALAVLVLSAVTLGLYFGWSPGFWAFIRNTPISGDWGHSRRIPVIRRRRALSLSLARYTVMLTQFVLALQAFHHMAAGPWVDHTVHQTAGSAMTWGLTSLAPVPLLGDLGLREASALLVLPTPTAQDVTAIVGATLSLWIINLILPALVGLGWQWNVTRIRARHANLPL